MNALSPIVAIDPALATVGIWPVPDAPTPRTLGYAESARRFHTQAQRMHGEAVARMDLANAIRDPFMRAEAVRREMVEFQQCAGVLAETTKYLARVCGGDER